VEGVTGFLAETDEDLSERLERLIGQPELRQAMGKAAIAHGRKFDWNTIARSWQDAFEQVVAKRQRHRAVETAESVIRG
jgi:glycosyltransferase involved in cell wall biosynthesis